MNNKTQEIFFVKTKNKQKIGHWPITVKMATLTHNHAHNIFRHFLAILPNFPFTTSDMKRDY